MIAWCCSSTQLICSMLSEVPCQTPRHTALSVPKYHFFILPEEEDLCFMTTVSSWLDQARDGRPVGLHMGACRKHISWRLLNARSPCSRKGSPHQNLCLETASEREAVAAEQPLKSKSQWKNDSPIRGGFIEQIHTIMYKWMRLDRASYQ